MQSQRLVVALAVVAALAFPVLAVAQHDHDQGGGGGHGGGHPPAGGSHPPAGGYARGGHVAGPGGSWVAHPVWHGAGEFGNWRGGHWWTGTYAGRAGAWWIVGPDWYWYPSVIAGIPDPNTPPGMAPGYRYWCDAYQQYYPYVGACPSGWQPIAMP